MFHKVFPFDLNLPPTHFFCYNIVFALEKAKQLLSFLLDDVWVQIDPYYLYSVFILKAILIASGKTLNERNID